MKPMGLVVPVVLCGAVWTTTVAADGPAACRPLRPAPVTTASVVAPATQPAVPLPEPQTTLPDAGLDAAGPDDDRPAADTPVPEFPPIQRVAPAPWEYMKCVPPAPCPTPCYADCVPCEARSFRSTAPKCCHQAIHESLKSAVWNFLDLHHAMHECCRTIHNTHFTPDPWHRPYPYNECR